MNREFLKMQKTAGLITESEYNLKVNRLLESQVPSDVEQKALKLTQDPKFQQMVQATLNKLSDKQKEEFKQELVKNGVLKLEESSSQVSPFSAIIDKMEKITEELAENETPEPAPNADLDEFEAKLGPVLTRLGKISAIYLSAPALWMAKALGGNSQEAWLTAVAIGAVLYIAGQSMAKEK
jgi:hypothetical protein